MTYFSLTCTSFEIFLPCWISPKPPSFRANSASIKSRWFLSSQLTPLKEPPPSSSAVRATMMSASRPKAFPLVANQIGDPDGGLCFVVSSTPTVEIAIALDELERISAPVLALCLDYVGVGQKQDRFFARLYRDSGPPDSL